MHQFLLATGNAHKAEEFAKIFNPEVLKIEAAPEKLDVIEDGLTFNENALLKAKAYYEKFGKPVMADDSGLCVEALPEELGIYSARFGGEGLDNRQRAELLLEKMKGEENRKAYFVCVLCFYLGENEIYFFEGRVDGTVSQEYKGEHGFGYDPVFEPLGDHGGKSLAELPEWKDENSHRAKACFHAEKFFKERC
ncbi:RdgB/HAM1 family non-canonical purine NTP pyrophosphatase [Bacteriovorax sp. DB6_IX]|uniref:RdgB/HAM1 family non-canonical purine NTP pyrophosphatase n=1 Tax=Bacteriovorax sp. DB6_IX TaxID=1353530 RepID=UPI000389DA61|nr:RdgB/HAM1 family non-canonical purine NTP pyrophosphatase [Bacteriovorax sp. DB6_IX]EQC51267.1 non-canonical purine NTP pyrophosphatase, RdgB/HAM1 family [Bacteriovorax sp. DB6_IX]